MDDLQFDVLEPQPLGGRLAQDIENLLNFDAPLVATQPRDASNEPAVSSPALSPSRGPPSRDPQSQEPGSQELRSEEAQGEEPALLAEQDDERKPNLISLVAPYCNVTTLFSFAAVSQDARRIATDDSIWKPLCRELGVAEKTSDPADLISFASAFNVLDLGYTSDERSAYTTFCRAYTLLRPVVANAKQAVSSTNRQVPLNHLDKALLLTGAMKLSEVLCQADEMPSEELATLKATIQEEEEDLHTDLAQVIDKQEPVGPLLVAYNIWWQRLGRNDLRQKAVDIYFSKRALEWDAEEAFSFDTESDSKTASARKLSMFFHALVAHFSGSRRALQDPNAGIPAGWQEFMRSVFFDRFTRLVNDYVEEVLRLAQAISENEYLTTVPKVYSASRTLLDSDVLNSSGEWSGNVIKEMLCTHFLDNMVDEFCMRQLRYFESDASEKVRSWTSSVSERESEAERFIWSSVPRKRDKTNFVTAFKWAVSSLNRQDDESEADNSLEMDATEALSTPQTEFEAQTAVLVSKFKGMESLVSLELVISILESCRAAFHRLKIVEKEEARLFEPMFVTLIEIVGRQHIKHAFDKAIKVLNAYDPKRFGRLVISLGNSGKDTDDSERKGGGAVEPLVMFTELVNVGDLVQQMVHVFFEEELVSTHLVRKSNFGSSSVSAKRKFEQMLDDMLAEGLSRGIDVLMDQVEFTLVTEQLGSDYLPVPTQEINLGPTVAALKVIGLVKSHLDLLKDSTEKTLFDVFQQEVGMRLFTAITKHIKSQTVSVEGAVTLISDINAYYAFMLTLKQKTLYPYYEALKQVGQLYLVDTKDAKQLGLAVSDVSRYNGVISTEELVEFLKRRQDWLLVRSKVERVLYGVFECIIS